MAQVAPENSIGVFDSGLGGLTVLREIHRLLPQENLIYFGDTARVPYGNKSAATVIRYSKEIVQFLLARNVKAIVVACNTASSYALETIKQMTDVPVIGVIDPALRALVRTASPQAIAGLIATRGTIQSGAYPAALQRLGGKQKLVTQPCPLLVPLIEEGYTEGLVCELIVRDYLEPLVRQGVGYLILGCTHYPLLAPLIRRLYPQFHLIDSAEETAHELAAVLANASLNRKEGTARIELYVSDMTESVRMLKDRFFAGKVDIFTEAQLAEY
ncbi:MAG: glutamate racemase [Leptospiraceae bacterium]|nr:glutamate racemase [Leptospiraceae bacterium]